MATNRMIKLPAPKNIGKKTVLDALRARRTVREISGRSIPLQVLSGLLWAAFGINRKKGPFGIPGRTAGSASNSQEIELYVAMENGAYLYDASSHSLVLVLEDDLRSLAINKGQNNISPDAPVRIIYVVDIDKLVHSKGYMEPGLIDPDVQRSYYFVDCGWIAGNAAVFASSIGLEAWFHNCQRDALAKKLDLPSSKRVLFAQTFGWAGKRTKS